MDTKLDLNKYISFMLKRRDKICNDILVKHPKLNELNSDQLKEVFEAIKDGFDTGSDVALTDVIKAEQAGK